jgi:hypothetical protein
MFIWNPIIPPQPREQDRKPEPEEKRGKRQPHGFIEIDDIDKGKIVISTSQIAELKPINPGNFGYDGGARCWIWGGNYDDGPNHYVKDRYEDLKEKLLNL